MSFKKVMILHLLEKKNVKFFLLVSKQKGFVTKFYKIHETTNCKKTPKNYHLSFEVDNLDILYLCLKKGNYFLSKI